LGIHDGEGGGVRGTVLVEWGRARQQGEHHGVSEAYETREKKTSERRGGGLSTMKKKGGNKVERSGGGQRSMEKGCGAVIVSKGHEGLHRGGKEQNAANKKERKKLSEKGKRNL